MEKKDFTAPSRRTAAALPLHHLAAVTMRLSEAIEDGDTPFAASLVDELQRQLVELIDRTERRSS